MPGFPFRQNSPGAISADRPRIHSLALTMSSQNEVRKAKSPPLSCSGLPTGWRKESVTTGLLPVHTSVLQARLSARFHQAQLAQVPIVAVLNAQHIDTTLFHPSQLSARQARDSAAHLGSRRVNRACQAARIGSYPDPGSNVVADPNTNSDARPTGAAYRSA